MVTTDKVLGLEGEFAEQELPLLVRRSGMSSWHDGVVHVLDRRQLPGEERVLDCHSADDVAVAIEDMVIQGAFSLAIAAGYGMALAAKGCREPSLLEAAAVRLGKTRPTGLALQRMLTSCVEVGQRAIVKGEDPCQVIVANVDQAAATLARQGWKTGQRAAEMLEDGMTILTHCFPDRSYVYLLMEAKRSGKKLTIVCSETRPYLQGARLTALCAVQAGFETRVITDSMSGFLMRRGEIDVFVTAADRVCMDGTVCNKIGTYTHALAARANGIPYYTLRQSGPDTESGGETDVEIEYRDGEELLRFGGQRIAASGVNGLYPGFDITPPDLVSRIITDRGVFLPEKISSYVDAKPFVTGEIL